MTQSFWKQALASFPPSVQRRYAAEFEAAERLEQRLDFAIAMWNKVKHALATAFHRRRAARRRAAREPRRLQTQ